MATNYRWSDLWSGDRGRAVAAANSLLPAWVSLVIAVLIGWQLAKIIWMLVPGPTVGPIEYPANSAVFASSSAADGASTAAIADAHLFGEAGAEEESAPVAELADLEETSLGNLKLRGTIASEIPEFSIAIIADSGNEEKVYTVGDAVAAGASLHAVYPDRVVLDERGALTNLSLPREFAPSRSNYIAPTIPTLEEEYVEESGDAEEESIQSVVAQNVSRLADVIRPTPYFVNGQQQGYRVYPGRDRELFSSMGLRPGDLIREIDGQSLSDPTQAMEIFQSLGTATQVSVTVERDGTPETIVLRTDQLDLGKETH
jgi:general secretion pathway protein C